MLFTPGRHDHSRGSITRSRLLLAPALLAALLVSFLGRDLAGQPRSIGLALGGGSARGFAHVGVLRWLEEHHIPIAAIAGTSMGGLVGGSYAAGMSPRELETLLDTADWDELFGATAYRYKTIRRKEDARDYPSRLEFHIRRGFAMPSALNNGQQIDLLLSRLGAAYGGMASFDSLPTPFRCVALDIRTGDAVVLDRGSLATAMRATMSLPGIFPPVRLEERMLVDGGPMNNVPADVARAMGVDFVIAVDVGSAKDTTNLEYSVFGLVGAVSDALIRANTERGMAAANVVIHPDLKRFSGLDWRRAPGLIAAGYAAAEAMRDQLLPLAVDDSTWHAYVAGRTAQRLALPTVVSIATEGMTREDARRVRRLLAHYVNRRADPVAFDYAVLHLSGMDRYLSVAWELRRSNGAAVLVVRARPRNTAPPILMTTVNAENRTSDDFLFQIGARMLAYDVAGAGNELRVDGVVGTDPSVGAELVHPFASSGSTTLFLAGAAAWESRRFDITHDDAIVAQYRERRAYGQGELGFERAEMEIRAGARIGSLASSVKVGNPGLPSLSGTETEVHLRGVFDSQNSATIPSEGVRVVAWARRLLDSPEPSDTISTRTNRGLTQAELATTSAWSWRRRAERVFIAGFAGTSFGGAPLFTDQFTLGLPMRLDAFEVGERRGDHYGVLTAGYLHAFARLPDVLGGSIIGGAWLETGSAFDEWSQASVSVQGAVGVIIETLIGPAVVRYSAGGGARRFAIGFGRLF